MPIDPVTEEIVATRLWEVVEHMERVLFHGGYSPILRESFDGSATILNARGEVVVGSGFPIHLIPYWRIAQAVLRAYPPQAMAPGDVFATNDPFLSGNFHVPDMAVITPVFVDGQLLGFCASIAHKPDVGGMVPGSSSAEAREAWHEGIVLPVVRYATAEGPSRDLEALLRRNSRTPDEVAGDMRAQIGAVRVGVERLTQLVAEYGLNTLQETFEHTIARAERRLREGIARWGDGVGEAEAWLDGDGVAWRPVRIHVRAEKRGEAIHFDFSQSDPATQGPVSVRPQATETATLLALLGAVDPTIPINEGVRRVLSCHNPEGLVTHAGFPAAVNNYYPTMQLIYACVQSALAAIDPESAVAPAGFGIGGNTFGYGPDGVQYELLVSSLGATAHADGSFACQAMSQITPSTPIEILETEYPVEVTACTLWPDSAGAGTFRGGVGFIREYRVLKPATFTLRMAQFQHPAWGILGGLGPPAAGCAINPGSQREERLPALANRKLMPGDVVRFYLPGGGGYGPPSRRDPERVLADVRDGVVSKAAAETIYRVVLDPSGDAIDWEATRKAREELA
ncbi:MAG: hydantoinase B/oxoprolinase family protein [Firmicutes bacterium]|nr:hydantoinase B/oxoprolinase family protein [Bacillota bacterium]